MISVLYVDDEEHLLTIGKLFLERSGDFIVTTVSGATEAIDLLRNQTFDSIISDYQMPGMDGIAFLKHLKSAGDSTPFILFTGRGREEVIIEALNNGAEFYLQKGGEPRAQFAELSKKIHHSVSRRRAEKDLIQKNKELKAAYEKISASEEELRANYDELRRQEQLIRESEERFRGIFNSSLVGIAITDPEGKWLFFNNTLCTMLGYSPQELKDKTWAEITPPESLEEEMILFRSVLAGNDPGNIEKQYFCKDGSRIDVIVSTGVIRNSDGEIEYFSSIIQNISERKRIENILRIHEDRLLMSEKIGQTGSWEFNIETKKIWGSAEGHRIFGYPPIAGDFPIDEIESCIPDRDRVHQALVDLLTDGSEYDLEYLVHPADSSADRMVHSVARLEKDAQGSPIRVIGIIQDITERKEIEVALKQSEERLRLTLEATNDGIWDWNIPTGSAIFNPRYYTMLGYEPNEFSPTYATWRSLIHPDDLQAIEQRITDHIQNKEDGYTVEFRMQTKNQNWIWILSRGKVIERDGVGNPVRMVGTHKDITDRKRAEEDRERLIIDLSANNEELHAAYEEISATEEELRHQYETIARTEAVLRQTTGYLENLITIANVPIIVWDSSFQIIRLNHAFELLIGRSAEEVIGSPLELLFSPEHRERSIRLLRTSQEGVRWETVEIDIIHQNGSLRTLLWNSATLFTPDGLTAVATIAQGHDITEERRLEREKELAVTQIKQNLAQLAILNDGIRNPLTVISLSANQVNDKSVTDQIFGQIQKIDEMITQLDRRWIESDKVLDYLQKHYLISYNLPDKQTLAEEEVRNQPGVPKETELSGRKGSILIEEVQAQLYTILDSIDAMVYVADMKTHELLYMNRKGRAAYGDVLGQKCYTVIHQNMSGPCTFCTNHFLTDETGQTEVYQWEFQNPKTGRWYDCRDRAIRWTDGRLVRLEIATDITNLKQGEEELREKEAALLEDHHIARMGRWNLDLKTGDLQWSEGVFELFEVNPAEFKATAEAFMELVHPDDRDRVNQAYTDSLANKKPYEIAHRLLMKDGRITWVNEICHTEYDKDGNPLRSVGVVQDITRLKEAEEALRQSEVRIRKTLGALLSPEGNIQGLTLTDIIDAPEIQDLIEDFYTLTRIGVAIVDSAGNILASTGWQDICSKFHRVNPETRAHCLESDTILTQGIDPGTSRLYRCKNNMWDFSTPIVVGGVHLGNLFIGQFLFDDEELDYSLFREQAKRYGFDEEAYIAALDNVLRWDRETVNTVMDLYSRFIHLITQLSWSNVKLARTVTERDTLLISVQGSEEKLRRYLNNAPNGIFIADEEGRYIEVNPAACTITGYSESELVQMRTFDLIPPESLEDAAKHFERVVETGRSSGELPFRHKDGSLRYWFVDAVQLSPTRLMGFVQDTTERRKMEESLRMSETKYRQVVEYANEAIVVLQGGILVLVNPKTAEFTGYPQEDLWHMPFFTFIHPDDRAMVVDRYQRRMRGEEPPSRYSFRLLKKDGTTAWVDISAVPIEWEGRPASLNFLIDITERRQTLEWLREREELLKTVISNLHGVVFSIDKNGIFLLSEGRSLTELGLAPGQLVGQSVFDVYRDVPDIITGITTVLHGTAWSGTVPVGEIIFDAVVSPVFDPGGNICGAVGIATDVTERTQMEETRSFLLRADYLHTGDDFFRSLARFLAEKLHMDYVCIDRLEGDLLSARTVAVYFDEKFELDVTYTLHDTPCGEVVGKRICIYPDNVRHLFPNDIILQEMKAESYVGITLWGFDGNPIGLIAIIGRNPLTNTHLAESILHQVGVRAAAELERTLAEEALRESEEQHRVIVSALPDTLFILNNQGVYLRCHAKEPGQLLAPPEEFIGKSVLDIMPKMIADKSITAISKTLENGDLQIFEYYLDLAMGRKWFEIRMVRSTSDTVLAMLRDISGRKLAEEALRESNQKLRLLTSLTRHDIFNQVTAVQLLLDLASDSSNLSKIHEYISRARQAGDQIEKTIGFTREYESFGTSSSGWQRISQVIESAKGEVSPGTISIENQIPDTLEIYADPIIRKVFSTLMENAIRHGENITNIRIFCPDPVDTLIIICEDDGVGVPSEQKGYIFDHGYGKHTGIGLFIAREILSITGLSIRECGEPGKGARFEILVPGGKFRIPHDTYDMNRRTLP